MKSSNGRGPHLRLFYLIVRTVRKSCPSLALRAKKKKSCVLAWQPVLHTTSLLYLLRLQAGSQQHWSSPAFSVIPTLVNPVAFYSVSNVKSLLSTPCPAQKSVSVCLAIFCCPCAHRKLQ